MNDITIKSIDKDRVPVIDINKINSNSDKIKISKQLYKASTDLGFIYIKNHNISDKLINDLRNDGLTFLEVHLMKKRKSKFQKSIEVG